MSDKKKDDLPADAELDALKAAVEAYEKGNAVKEIKAEKREQLAGEQFKSVMLDNKITRISESVVAKGNPGAGSAASASSPEANPNTQVAAVQDRNQAQMIQYGTGLITVTISTLWITYFGQDAPAEVYGAIAALIPLVGQAIATKYNNRKV